MTSHPKDLSDELIEVMAPPPRYAGTSTFLCSQAPPGSCRPWNRRYTKEQYLELVDKIRTAMPDIALTTDIIVGFPGEKHLRMWMKQ